MLQTGMSPEDRETVIKELLLFAESHAENGLLSISFGEAERAVREGSVDFSDERWPRSRESVLLEIMQTKLSFGASISEREADLAQELSHQIVARVRAEIAELSQESPDSAKSQKNQTSRTKASGD